MTYHWHPRRSLSGKQFDLVDAHGRTVAFVHPSFPEWTARHVLERFNFFGSKDACLAEVEKWFGIAKSEKTGRQQELFR